MSLRYFLGVVLMTTLAACMYGIVHDQLTIRICPEYFTVWHPPVFVTDDLTVLALIWGIIATWWFGAIVGVIFGFLASTGSAPTVCPVWIFQRTLRALAVVGVVAAVCGLLTWMLHVTAPPFISGAEISSMGDDLQRRFTVDLVVHNVSYFGSAVAALVIAIKIILRRRRMIACEGETCSLTSSPNHT